MSIPVGKIKALVKSSGVGLEYREDIPIPSVGPRDMQIRVISASICGSYQHIYNNDYVFHYRVMEGLIIQHEFCGKIIKGGNL